MLATFTRMLNRPRKPGCYVLSDTCQIPDLATIYKERFGLRNDGTFVEVGAFDGEYVSNTSGLADAGWRGFYIEPVPEHAAECRRRHRRNRRTGVHELAIGATGGEATLHVGGPLTTADPDMVDLFSGLDWAKDYHRGQTVRAKQITLDRFLESQSIEPGFELVVIDVEGFEWPVLQGFSLDRWRPQMVIVELHDQNDTYRRFHGQCRQIVDLFDRHAYRAIFKDSSNTIYVRPD